MVGLLESYGLSIAGISVLVLIILSYGPILGPAKGKAEVAPGGEAPGGWGDRLYRMDRSHQNSVESFAIFTVLLVIGMLIGLSPTVLAILTWIHVAARFVYIYVYVKGLGQPAGGLRSMIYVVGWVMNLILALLVGWAGITA